MSRRTHDPAPVFDPDVSTLLSADFFARDTRAVARDLLGKLLVSGVGTTPTGGRIVETEAYLGSHDPGSHAATRGQTARNAVMYGRPGTVYVYFSYGMHHMVNLVCEPEGTAGAVLIRAIEPLFGLDTMRSRRAGRPQHEFADGPGKVAQALAIDLSHNGSALGEGGLAVYDAAVPPEPVGMSGRIGLSRGHEHEYRYFLEDNRFVSRGRPGAGPQRRGGKRGRTGGAT